MSPASTCFTHSSSTEASGSIVVRASAAWGIAVDSRYDACAFADVAPCKRQMVSPEARHTVAAIHRGGPFPYDRDGTVFGNFLEGALRNPAAADSQQGRLFIGFAAAALLGLIAFAVAMIILYAR